MSFIISQSLLKLMSVEPVMPSNHLILCHPLFLLPSIFPSIRVFSSVLPLRIRWLKYWSFSLSISPSNEYSGLTYFKIDWFDLFAVQGTLKNLQKLHNSKASILWRSAEIKILCYCTLYSTVPYCFRLWLYTCNCAEYCDCTVENTE